MNVKDIHIGILIKKRVIESEIEMARICNFFKTSEQEIETMFESKNLDTELLLKWSKILKYDFFRLYSHHLILYCPPSNMENNIKKQKSVLPEFRKNIYTKEIIDFILELIKSGEKTRQQIINEYRIPKTTLYKWIKKYQP